IFSVLSVPSFAPPLTTEFQVAYLPCKTKMATTRQPKAKAAAPSARMREILTRLEKVHPDAKLALDFTNPLELLIALILAAQARDDLVNKVTVDLFKTRRTAADYAAAPPATLRSQIGKINFYRNKAQSIHNCC